MSPLWLLACADPALVPVAGTTARIEAVESGGARPGEETLDIFLDEARCAATVREGLADCPPFVDRATGEVRLGFAVRAGATVVPSVLDADTVEVYHKTQSVKGGEQTAVAVVPHDPETPRALYLLLIDGSGSMAYIDEDDGRTRMDKVRDALADPRVTEAFLAPGSAVAPFVFRGDGEPVPLHPSVVIEDAATYRAAVEGLVVGSGYTFLYQAVDTAVDRLLAGERVQRSLEVREQEPVIIALTDGFNNERPDDVCADNAPRLERLLTRLAQRRAAPGRTRPQVWTIGLGYAAFPDTPLPDRVGLDARALCPRAADRRIDGDLETLGVDNRALALIAREGGGRSYTTRSQRGLADAFRAAALPRHRWFEVRYRVDPFLLRRPFEARLHLVGRPGVAGTVKVHPHGWLDAPPGTPGADGWVRPTPLARSLLLVLPVLAGLVGAGYLPPAVYNLYRAVRGRVARRGPRS